MEAMWDCASQLWVPGRLHVHGRPYLSFCAITLQHFSFRFDEYGDGCLFKKEEQIGTLFVRVGAPEGGFGGGGCQEGPPQK